jgi:hypothetical protein
MTSRSCDVASFKARLETLEAMVVMFAVVKRPSTRLRRPLAKTKRRLRAARRQIEPREATR